MRWPLNHPVVNQSQTLWHCIPGATAWQSHHPFAQTTTSSLGGLATEFSRSASLRIGNGFALGLEEGKGGIDAQS